MITGRMLTGNFVYVFGVAGQPFDPSNAAFAKKRQKIIKEFESYARVKKRQGHNVYGAVYNFPTESGARQWVASKKLPDTADMMLTVTGMGRARVVRA